MSQCLFECFIHSENVLCNINFSFILFFSFYIFFHLYFLNAYVFCYILRIFFMFLCYHVIITIYLLFIVNYSSSDFCRSLITLVSAFTELDKQWSFEYFGRTNLSIQFILIISFVHGQ